MRLLFATVIAGLLISYSCTTKSYDELHPEIAGVKLTESSKKQVFSDTLQYLGETEGEDNVCALFLTKRKDTLNIVLRSDKPLDDKSIDKVFFVEWENVIIASGGDVNVKYEQAFATDYKEIKLKPFQKTVTADQFLLDISKLPEVKEVVSNEEGIFISEGPGEEHPYYVVQVGNQQEDHFTTIYWFYVYIKPKYEIKYYDLANEKVLSLEEWRANRKSQK